MSLGAPQTIELDGRTLAWRAVGAGPPLLLVNGYAATGTDWDPTLLTTRVERFGGGGHAFMAQEPRRLAELIVAFARA